MTEAQGWWLIVEVGVITYLRECVRCGVAIFVTAGERDVATWLCPTCGATKYASPLSEIRDPLYQDDAIYPPPPFAPPTEGGEPGEGMTGEKLR